MGIAKLRQTLTHALESAEQGNVSETVRVLKAALQDVDRDRLLTTTEAAQLLGVRSINTVKAWCRTGYITCLVQGGRTLIPMAEIERIQESDRVRGIRTAERLHAESAALGGDDELSQEELDALDAGRPGTLPWQRGKDRTQNGDEQHAPIRHREVPAPPRSATGPPADGIPGQTERRAFYGEGRR